MNKQGKDLREFERIPTKVQLSLAQIDGRIENETTDNVFSKDIAEKGVCVLSDNRYKVGSLLSVEINLEGWQKFLQTILKRDPDSIIQPLKATGKVIWSQKLPGSQYIQTGIHFIEFNADDFTAFKKYLHIIRESIKENS